MLILEMGPHSRSCPDFAISEGYPKNSFYLISYAVLEALSLAHSLVLSLQIIYKQAECGNTVECPSPARPDNSLHAYRR